jgi:hypothetical protein
MRTQILAYLKTQNLGTLAISNDLPFDDSGVALYTKNVKKVYVDQQQVSNEPVLQTLGGVNINNQAASVTIYFAIDAKNLVPNYDTIVSTLQAVKDNVSIPNVHTRSADVSTEYVDDLLITTTTITLTKIA